MNKTKLRNYVAIVLDKSKSMESYAPETVNAFNTVLRQLRNESLDSNQETLVSLITFADKAQVEILPTDVFEIDFLTLNSYRPYGMTALYDGMGKAIEVLSKQKNVTSKYTSHLVIVVTDGGENQSVHWSQNRLKNKIGECSLTDRWTFTVQCPRGHANDLAYKLGLPYGNLREWETTQQGMRDVAKTTSIGISNYYGTRRAGGQSVKTFYTE